MTQRLILRPEAELDLIDARDWYRKQAKRLETEFLTAVEESLNRILTMPLLYALEYKSVRRARTRRFPYIIYYRINGEVIEVLAVLHGSRHPSNWRSRS
jgi:plasmid stabilization system protein ParE